MIKHNRPRIRSIELNETGRRGNAKQYPSNGNANANKHGKLKQTKHARTPKHADINKPVAVGRHHQPAAGTAPSGA